MTSVPERSVWPLWNHDLFHPLLILGFHWAYFCSFSMIKYFILSPIGANIYYLCSYYLFPLLDLIEPLLFCLPYFKNELSWSHSICSLYQGLTACTKFYLFHNQSWWIRVLEVLCFLSHVWFLPLDIFISVFH